MIFGFFGTYVADVKFINTPLNSLISSPTKRDAICDLMLYPNVPTYEWVEFNETPYAIVKNQTEYTYPTEISFKATKTVNQNEEVQEASIFNVIPPQNSTRYVYITATPLPDYSIRYNSSGDRTFTYKISNPDYVYGMMLGNGSNAQYNNSSDGVEDGITDGNITDLWKFYNLKALSIKPQRGSYVRNLGVLPQKVEQLTLYSLHGITEFPTIPSSVKYLQVANINTSLEIAPLLSNVENLLNLKVLALGGDSGFPTTIFGMGFTTNGEVLDLTNHSQLTEIFLFNNNTGTASVTGIDVQFPTHDLKAVSVIYNNALNIDQGATLRALLKPGNSDLRIFYIGECPNFSPTWNITSADVKDSQITQFGLSNTPIGGTIDFTEECPNIVNFYTTRAGTGTGNNMTSIKLSGLTNATLIRVNGNPLLEYLELPLPPVKKLSTLSINENPLLNVTNNPKLKAQLSGNTELVTLNAHIIQSLGTDLDLSLLTKLTTLNLGNSGLSGTLILPASRAGNGITGLNVYQNPNLTSIQNLSVHDLMATINTYMSSVSIDYTLMPNVLTINSYLNSGQTHINLSNINTTSLKGTMNVRESPTLKSITFPANENYFKIGTNGDMHLYTCPQLTGLTNLEYVGYNTLTGNWNHDFNAYNCALDITFPFGVIAFCPVKIVIQNNGMSVANVDATINNIYENRTKWSGYTSAKSMNISGTNAVPSGTYQAPSGFILGSNDGTPVSAKEQIYVLVNNYNWTITMN